MKKQFLTSARVAYEPPYADIIEFAVERGFDASFNSDNGTEVLGREEAEDSWHS